MRTVYQKETDADNQENRKRCGKDNPMVGDGNFKPKKSSWL